MRALIVGVAVLSFVAVGCGGDKSGSNGPAFSCDKVQPAGFPTSTEGLNVDDTLPDQSFVDINGNQRCTRDFTGKVVMISIGAGWCPPCQAETPGMQEVYEEFKGDGFEILQVMYEDYDGGDPDPEFMEYWEDYYNVTFTMVPDPQVDFFGNLVPPPADAIPHNILLSRDGVVEYTEAGSLPESQLRTRVNALVSAQPLLEYEN